MKCMECGADLYEGIKKCPYCKTPTEEAGNGRDFDIKYTISSEEAFRTISKSVLGEKNSTSKKKRTVFPAVRRIQKPEKSSGKLNSSNIGEKDFNAEERARELAKSASQRAAEFVPEGAARYTIRGAEYTDSQSTKIGYDIGQVNEINRTRRTSKPKFERRKAYRVKKRKKAFNFKLDKSLSLMAGASVLAVLVVILAISLIVSLTSSSSDKVASYTYIKDNTLYMVYKGKTSKLSEQVISDSYVRYAEETESAPLPEKAAKNASIIKESKDGKRTFFFEDFDPETNSGVLKLVKSGRTKKVVEISPAVHNSIVMSNDGKDILYLQSTDENGDMGVLYYWNDGLDEPFKIATDIDSGTFSFAGDEKWALFIQNLNRVEMHGDLYAKSLEDLKEEKVKIETSVGKIYGVNPTKAAYIYAKDYDKNDKSFDIYAINKKGRSIRLGERTKRDPLMQKTKDKLFVYGMSEDNTSNLYTVDINNGKKEKIASGVNSILMLSKDEKTVIYDKVYIGSIADYYAYTKGKQPQMIAHNVVVDYNAVSGKPQMAIDEDAEKILYISEFEGFKGGGTLKFVKYKRGQIVSEEQIAEDVHSVYRAEDGNFIIAKDFSTTRKIFDVYLFDGKELKLLKEEVSPEMFDISRLGDNIYCVSGFGVEGKYGTLEKINLKGEVQTVQDGVFDFEVTPDDDLLIYKNLSTENGVFDLGLRLNGRKKILEIDKEVDEILGY